MALKVKLSHEALADGTELSVGDYFLAKVGEDVIVNDETLARFEHNTGQTLKDYLETSGNYKVTHATKAEVAAAYPEDHSDEVVFTQTDALESAGVEPDPGFVDPATVNEEGGES